MSRSYDTTTLHNSDLDALKDVLRQAREALLNVPTVGDKYDRQHSDMHTCACLAIGEIKQSASRDRTHRTATPNCPA